MCLYMWLLNDLTCAKMLLIKWRMWGIAMKSTKWGRAICEDICMESAVPRCLTWISYRPCTQIPSSDFWHPECHCGHKSYGMATKGPQEVNDLETQTRYQTIINHQVDKLAFWVLRFPRPSLCVGNTLSGVHRVAVMASWDGTSQGSPQDDCLDGSVTGNMEPQLCLLIGC